MKNRILVFVLAAMILQVFGAVAWAAEPEPKVIRLDLATLPVGQVSTRPGGPGAYSFVLVNVVPSLAYTVNITRSFVEMPPLVFPPRGGRPERTEGPERVASACDEALAALDTALNAAKTETEVKAIGVKHIADAPPNCDVQNAFKRRTELAVDEGDAFRVGRAETLTIAVSRTGATWTYVLEGTPSGRWRTSFGFFFVPDRDEKFFTEETSSPTAGESIFTIREQEDREELDFIPTVLFTFLPHSQIGRTWSNGWTAGLGYDLEKPVVVAGYAGAYNENVIFTAGLAFHRQTRLLGKYKVDDTVEEALESSQLVEDTYGPNVYVGVSFRFGEDIHGRREELERETAAAKAEAAAAKARAAQAEKEAAERKAACEAAADEAEAAAKKACAAGDATCVTNATIAAAAAKAKCAVTEQERRDAAIKEKRTLCEAAADTEKARAVGACGNPNDADAAKAAAAKQCIATANSVHAAARLKCLP